MKDVFLFQKQISKKGPTLHSIEQQGTLENLEKEYFRTLNCFTRLNKYCIMFFIGV